MAGLAFPSRLALNMTLGFERSALRNSDFDVRLVRLVRADDAALRSNSIFGGCLFDELAQMSKHLITSVAKLRDSLGDELIFSNRTGTSTQHRLLQSWGSAEPLKYAGKSLDGRVDAAAPRPPVCSSDADS
jgi:hypothetical protein